MIGLVVWFMVVENLVVSFAPSVGKFFPLAAGDALTGIKLDQAPDRPARRGRPARLRRGVLRRGTDVTKRSDVT